MSVEQNDVELPIRRQDADTLEERMTQNAYENILPERYLGNDEEPEDLFERVAKNISIAEAVYHTTPVYARPSDIKPDHPRRQDLIQDVFECDTKVDSDGIYITKDIDSWVELGSESEEFEIELTEENASKFSYDTVYNRAPKEVRECMQGYKEEFQELMENLEFMPNSPTLMNAGDELQQLSACFVDSPDDDLSDIHETACEAAEVFQSGGGMGYAFWKLRPYGDEVGSSDGIASGPITFMRTYDQMCETIAQGGARRGAQMGVMRVSHPDVIEFIHAKNKDVSLAHTLRLNDPDDYTYNSFSEALEEARELINDGKVPKHLRNAVEGHLSNFNISVGITDDFMEAVFNDEEYTFTNPRTGEVHISTPETKEMYARYDLGDEVEVGEPLRVSAKELWDRIVEGAHSNGEPGLIFLERVNKQHSFDVEEYPEHQILATNPCLVGDSKVATADGREAVPIEELSEEDGKVPVYTLDESGNITIVDAEAFKTKSDADIVEVTTNGNAKLRLTPDHRVRVGEEEWKEAQELEAGDSLNILTRYTNTGRRRIYGRDANGVLEHRLIAQEYLGYDIGEMDVHHVDGDEFNNSPANLVPMDHGEHASVHLSERNPIDVLKERGEFEEYKERNPFYNTKGEANPRYGVELSEETKQKISENTDYDAVAEKNSQLWEDSDKIKCRECGEKFGSVNNLHLRKHNMDTKEYRNKYPNAPMAPSKGTANHTVVSVEEVGSEDVYDLHVPENHNFFAGVDIDEGEDKQTFFNVHNCGEQPLEEYEACNLGHINLSTIVDKNVEVHDWRKVDTTGSSLEDSVADFLDYTIDWDELDNRIRLGTRFLENVVTMSDFPVPEIEEKVQEMRKIGLGIMGFAQLLPQLGVKYGSDVANEIARQLMTHINHESKRVSRDISTERGVFSEWDKSKYAEPLKYQEWFEHHTGESAEDWDDHSFEVWDGEEYVEKTGFPIRNHNTTTIAPTGTTSMVADTSGGCEPIYNVAYYKNVSDDVQGDEMLVEFDDYFLEFVEANGIDPQEVKAEAKAQMKRNEFGGIESLQTVPDSIAELFVTTGDLSAEEHATAQCAFQEGVDSAISKTVNAPNESTLGDAKEVFEYIYKNGGKGVTYYRDGTRNKQVLTTRQDNTDLGEDDILSQIEERADDAEFKEEVMNALGVEGMDQTDDSIPSVSKKSRPKELHGTTQRIETGYGKMYVNINKDPETGKPFELFVNVGDSGGLMNGFTEALAKTTSTALRSGADPEELSEDLRGIKSPKVAWDNGKQVHSIPDGIGRSIKRFLEQEDVDTTSWVDTENVEDEQVTLSDGAGTMSQSFGDEMCPECGKMTAVVKEGCLKCPEKIGGCGHSEC